LPYAFRNGGESMGRFFKALRAGLKGGWEAATESQPTRYSIEGRPVRCPHCGGGDFAVGKAQLNTAGMEFLNLAWANPSATTMLCGECGSIQWFAQEPQAME
jgi:ribosomal protein S27AE